MAKEQAIEANKTSFADLVFCCKPDQIPDAFKGQHEIAAECLFKNLESLGFIQEAENQDLTEIQQPNCCLIYAREMCPLLKVVDGFKTKNKKSAIRKARQFLQDAEISCWFDLSEVMSNG